MQTFLSNKFRFFAAIVLALLLSHTVVAGEDHWFDAWQNVDNWDVAGDVTLEPDNSRRLAGKPGMGILINGKEGNCPSLVTKRRDYRDVAIHAEFMVAKGSNSGVIFHGNHEIQIRDSYGKEKPTGGDCGGIYPRAEAKPTYHHIDAGSPPRVNAAKPAGEWQTLDIVFQAARFDEAGNKTADAKFVKVVHNGLVIQENKEVPYACGPNWDRKQFPQGPIVIQGDYGPIAIRNVHIKEIAPSDSTQAKSESSAGSHHRQTVAYDATHAPASVATKRLNVPPEGFSALFNGKDLTGWRARPKVKEMWSIEDGVLKSHGLLEQWGADLVTTREYQDYVLMVDFRMPALSDSGIHFRNLAPAMLGKMGDAEQFNIRSKGGMGQLESFHFVPEDMNLTAEQRPKVKYIDPEIGVWHTVKLTVVGKNVTAELDGEVILDHFEYPEGMLDAGPNPIRFQKHRFIEGRRPGEKNPCPIEFRNIFIKEIQREDSSGPRGLNVPPPGFTALFNGKDFTGWRLSPKAKEMWFIEDGVLKSPGLLRQWGADLLTEKEYRDFVLMLDFRMPTLSDSGVMFRRLVPEIPNFGDQEQFNLRSKDGVGHLESFYFLPHGIARNRKLREEDEPHVRLIDPKIGVWHSVKLTMQGRNLSAEYDGEVLYDRFKYPDWMMNLEPAPVRLQKHVFFDDDYFGKMNPCPIEYRNIFIKELKNEDDPDES